MKKMLFGLFFICFSSHAQIKSTLEVECMNRQQLAVFLNEFKELPFGIGNTMRGDEKGVQESVMILFINQKTRTWTIVEKATNNMYCVVSGGSDFNIVTTKETPT